MKKQLRTYEVYYRAGRVSTSTYFYTSPGGKPWILQVRAASAKQAKFYAAKGIVCPDLDENKKPIRGARGGIWYLDHSHGPGRLQYWPFDFDISDVGNCWGM